MLAVDRLLADATTRLWLVFMLTSVRLRLTRQQSVGTWKWCDRLADSCWRIREFMQLQLLESIPP